MTLSSSSRVREELQSLQKQKIEAAYKELQETQSQLIEAERMASLGQLVGGIAHEINNPVGYVSSNLTTLQKYLTVYEEVLDAPQTDEAGMAALKKKVNLKAIFINGFTS